MAASAGCAGESTDKPQPYGTPAHGGTLTFALPSDATSLSPFGASYQNVGDGSRLTALYDTLVGTDPATGSVQPHLAEALTPSGTPAADFTRVWTLTLRAGVKFSDGTPLDAAAVKFNWERHKDPRTGSYQRAAANNIAALTVADPLHLKITLPNPNANFDRLVAHSLSFIASPLSLNTKPADELSGAGPFLLKSWHPGHDMVLTRNPGYWQSPQGLPYLDQIRYVVDRDADNATLAVGKDIDMTLTIDGQTAAAADRAGKGVERVGLSAGGPAIIFNLNRPPFDDPKARQAIAYALDQREIDTRLYRGEGVPAKGIFTSSSPLGSSQLTEPAGDPTQAARLFAELTGNGTRKFSFTYIGLENPQTAAFAQFMQEKLNRYPGVAMTVQLLDIPTYVRTVRPDSDGWSIAIGAEWIDDPEPGLFDLVHTGGSANLGGYHSSTADQALERARLTIDPEQRHDAYVAVQQELNKDLPFWVYQEAFCAVIFGPHVTGVQTINDGLVQWDRIGLRDSR
ncbi:ABC transporter substrate-binding protein [Yinghuangia aomiensis]